jgi:hypothetical protein
MISSNENGVNGIIRRNINKIAFAALAFVALVVLLSVWFFAAKKPAAEGRPSASKQERLQTQR